MKLVTQTAICYWFHANAFDSWWRLALVLNGAVSWWVDSFVVIACTLVQTDTDNVNNPVRAADDIYWALIFNLDNKCVMCGVIARLCTFFFSSAQRFSFICWAFTRIIGTTLLTFFSQRATLQQPLYTFILFTPVSLLILDTSLCSSLSFVNSTLLWRANLALWWNYLTSCMPKNLFGPSCPCDTIELKGCGAFRSQKNRPPSVLTPPVRLLDRCKETRNPPHTSHKSCTGWGVSV